MSSPFLTFFKSFFIRSIPHKISAPDNLTIFS